MCHLLGHTKASLPWLSFKGNPKPKSVLARIAQTNSQMKQASNTNKKGWHVNSTESCLSHDVLGWTIRLSPGFLPEFPLINLRCFLNDRSDRWNSGVCVKTLYRGWRDGSVGKGNLPPSPMVRVQLPGGRREMTPLTYTHTLNTRPSRKTVEIKPQQKISSFLFFYPPEERPSFAPVLLGNFNTVASCSSFFLQTDTSLCAFPAASLESECLRFPGRWALLIFICPTVRFY